MLLRVYQVLTRLTGPLIDLYLLRRKQVGKEEMLLALMCEQYLRETIEEALEPLVPYLLKRA